MKKSYLLAPLFLLGACGGGEEVEELDYIETPDDIKIKEYLADKNWSPERTESGLYVYVENEGSPEKPSLDSYLTLNYEGYLLDGTVFDGTDGQAIAFPFPISQLIPGWQEGMPYFGKGGNGKLIIPPNLGYGDRSDGPIPPNSVLVFDVEVIDFADTKPAPQLDRSVDYSPEIQAYIKDKGIEGMIETESGLFVLVEEAGSDEKPDNGSFLTLNYEGYLLDGSSFDGTGGTATTFPFPLGNTIMGWQEGIPYFGKGGSGKLIIPPYMGYGPNDAAGGKIPGNSVLVFDFEIIDFTNEAPDQPGM